MAGGCDTFAWWRRWQSNAAANGAASGQQSCREQGGRLLTVGGLRATHQTSVSGGQDGPVADASGRDS